MGLQEVFGDGQYVIVGFRSNGAEQLMRLDLKPGDPGAAAELVEILKARVERTQMTESGILGIEHGSELTEVIWRKLEDGRRLMIAPSELWEHLFTLLEQQNRLGERCVTCTSLVEGCGPFEEVIVGEGKRRLRFHECSEKPWDRV